MESNLTEAQQILKAISEFPKQTMETRISAMHANDPIKADILVREFGEQTKTNYGYCVLSWTMEITDRIVAYIKK